MHTHSHDTRGLPEPLKATDSTKLPPDPETSRQQCIELNECQQDKDKENEFIDTILTG